VAASAPAGRRGYIALSARRRRHARPRREAFARGDYRWVAEVVNHLVFADPENEEAEDLFDALAIQIDGPRAGDRRITLHWRFTDTGEQYGPRSSTAP
jgi:alkyl sulfatase BDS1-like metallo-beta-lactamase superfamily hydrolase